MVWWVWGGWFWWLVLSGQWGSTVLIMWIFTNARSICHYVCNIMLFVHTLEQMWHWTTCVYRNIVTTMRLHIHCDSGRLMKILTVWKKISTDIIKWDIWPYAYIVNIDQPCVKLIGLNHGLSRFCLSCVDPVVSLLQKTLNMICLFPIFCPRAYLMKVIPETHPIPLLIILYAWRTQSFFFRVKLARVLNCSIDCLLLSAIHMYRYN